MGLNLSDSELAVIIEALDGFTSKGEFESDLARLIKWKVYDYQLGRKKD